MKNRIKKCAFLFALFLLMGALYALHAAKSADQPAIQLQKGDDATRLPSVKRKLLVYGYCRRYNAPTDICFIIRCLVYDNPLRYRNKPLPNDLSEQDLSRFDFTGCAFTYTNLSYTDLTSVILTNTTCDYQKAFLDNIKKNKIEGGDWYQESLPKDLKSIAQVYPQLNNNTHKAKLLHIASAFSQLPFYEGVEFYIKVEYWSFKLLQLKKELGNPYGKQLICSLSQYLNWDAKSYWWTTKYQQNKVDITTRAPHANFVQYLKEFNIRFIQYKCTSIYEVLSFDYYKKHIIKNIEGLKKAYRKIEDKQLQQEVCNIAHALSKSYQVQKEVFVHHYLFYQNQLIRLKKLVDLGVKNDIHYKNFIITSIPLGWSRGKK